ncbi:hypothetical protein CVN76_18175 [Bacillus sp. mrc49]|nr:hypothetical protein CVN76_18175 [Bacillus sp. mrc49]
MQRKAATLLREIRVYMRPRRQKAEEAQGPPAERERLQCNGTSIVQILKTLGNKNSSSFTRKMERNLPIVTTSKKTAAKLQ